MLDYILSKMVLLVFLLLLVSAFGLVKQSLDAYFLQQSARQFAKSISSEVVGLVTAVTSTVESRVILLPPSLKGGGAEMPYDLNVVAFEDASGNCYVAVIVLEQGSGKPVAADVVSLGTDTKVDTYYGGEGVVATASGMKPTYLIIRRVVGSGGEKTLQIYASDTSSGSPSGNKVVGCKP